MAAGCSWLCSWLLSAHHLPVCCSQRLPVPPALSFSILYAMAPPPLPLSLCTDPAYMAHLCRDHGITILEVVPSLATQYVRDLAPLGQAGQLRIRRFLTGGEALSVALANSVYDALPNCEMVWNTYGPTEVTVQVRQTRVDRIWGLWAAWSGSKQRVNACGDVAALVA